jgi:hypothetical protein
MWSLGPWMTIYSIARKSISLNRQLRLFPDVPISVISASRQVGAVSRTSTNLRMHSRTATSGPDS